MLVQISCLLPREGRFVMCLILLVLVLTIKQDSNKFQRMCGTISRTLKGKTQLSTQIKFYKVMTVPVLMYGSEIWSLN